MEVINSVQGDVAPLGSRSSQQAMDENDNNFNNSGASSDNDNGNGGDVNTRGPPLSSDQPPQHQQQQQQESQQRQTQGSVASSSPAASAASNSNNSCGNSYKCLKAVELENLANNNTLLETVVEEDPEDNSCAPAVAATVDSRQQQQLIEQQLLHRQLIEHQQLVQQDVSSSCHIIQQTAYRQKSESVSSQESHASSSLVKLSNSSGSCHGGQAVSSTGSSSRHHRVKFTEELPTAATGSYKRMTTTTSTLATAMTPEVVTDSSHPHITISEDFPTKDQDQTANRSAYEGWDNPFRPEGEISHEADELLRMWKEGKLTLKQNDEAGSGADHEQPNSLDCEVKTPLISQTDKSINGNSGHKNGTTYTSTTTPTTATVKREPSLTAKQVTIGSDHATSSPKKPKKTSGCCSVM